VNIVNNINIFIDIINIINIMTNNS